MQKTHSVSGEYVSPETEIITIDVEKNFASGGKPGEAGANGTYINLEDDY